MLMLPLAKTSRPDASGSTPPQNGRRRRQWRNLPQKLSVATWSSADAGRGKTGTGLAGEYPRALRAGLGSRGGEALRAVTHVKLEGHAPQRERGGGGRVRDLLQVGDGDVAGLLAEASGGAVRAEVVGVELRGVLADVDVGERRVAAQLRHTDQEVVAVDRLVGVLAGLDA